MAFVNQFTFAPAPWLPFRDQETLDRVALEDFYAHQGRGFEHPEFELKVVQDVHNYFSIDLFHRIRLSGLQNKRLVLILPSPENAVFISTVEALNKYHVSCRNVEIFFLYEYANENGDVAPWQSPYSRSGHFMRYFYQRLDAELRMPLSQIHFFTKENTADYSAMLAEAGGADVAYTSLSWSGGIGAIDAESFPADTMEEFLGFGSRLVTPMPEMIAHDSLRGMFGCSGDIGNVPPRAVTVGPKDLAAARLRFDAEFLTACGGNPGQQKFAAKLALFGPVCPKNPASMLRLYPGLCCVSADVARPPVYTEDVPQLQVTLDEIQKKSNGVMSIGK